MYLFCVFISCLDRNNYICILSLTSKCNKCTRVRTSTTMTPSLYGTPGHQDAGSHYSEAVHPNIPFKLQCFFSRNENEPCEYTAF